MLVGSCWRGKQAIHRIDATSTAQSRIRRPISAECARFSCRLASPTQKLLFPHIDTAFATPVIAMDTEMQNRTKKALKALTLKAYVRETGLEPA